MKTKTIPHPTANSYPRYPSLSDDFGRERIELGHLPGLSSAPRPDASVRLIYLRVIAVVITMMVLAAVVANG